jgi:penicillin amidase
MTPFLRRIARVLAAIGVLVLLLMTLVAGALWLTMPNAQQTASIPGLSGPVDITYDADGVPRIRAGSEQDAATALGFLHARDRMFQMELMRRAASGRL